ncbi:MAG: galactokinase, partial [Acidimicrobiales bacterium]
MSAHERASAGFAAWFGSPPTGCWAAPGRLNLVGEHTDYNDGFVLPFALARRTVVAAAAVHEPRWAVWSERAAETVEFGIDQLAPGAVEGWAGYVAGVVWSLRNAGYDVGGARLVVSSDVPVGAGLSSSAALECAVLAALADLSSLDVPLDERPRLAQQAEIDYVGVPCGIMDQTAATLCRPGHGLFLDCRTLAYEHVALDPTIDGLAVLVIDTRASHRLVTGEYAVRRRQCEAAATALGVRALRDASPTDIDRLDDAVLRRRARHVVTENDRVLEVVARLRAGDVASIGPLLTASHESLRDDFEVSSPELDAAVDAALGAGAIGARMTGAGFGGCALALVGADRVGA